MDSELLQPMGVSLGNQEPFLLPQRPLPPGWNLAGSREKHPRALGNCCLQVSGLARCSLVLAHF